MKKSTAPDRAREPKVRGLRLHRGESVALVVRPARSVTLHKYLMTLGLYGIWRKRKTFVLTDRRVVVGQGVFVRMEWSIPLDRVDEARYSRRGLSSYAELVVRERGGQRVERIGPLLPLTAKGFTHEVLAMT
jgi:hypothetical protein